MNRQEREVRKLNLSDEEMLLQTLYANYEEAQARLDYLLKDLMLSVNDPRVIYQMEYQAQLEAEIQRILSDLNSKNTESTQEFIRKCAVLGFVGALYSLYRQGFTDTVPMDTSVNTDAALRLAAHTANLQRELKGEFTRGVAAGMGYDQIAANAKGRMDIDLNNVMRVARTEGGRTFEENSFAAMAAAQKAGAKVMKEWSSVLDTKVRNDHLILHGQRVPLDEPYVLNSEDGNTYYAMYPHGFGIAKEDINCRCTSLPRIEMEGNSDFDSYESYKKYYKQALIAAGFTFAAFGNSDR